MNTCQNQEKKFICDACQKEVRQIEIRYMSLKTCCSIQRIPLCRVCYDKYAVNKKEEK
jgi:hypothetical protein